MSQTGKVWPSCRKPYRWASAKAERDKKKKSLLSEIGEFKSWHLRVPRGTRPPPPSRRLLTCTMGEAELSSQGRGEV